MVWLGVDLGEARVGLALSDPELTFAHPIGNIKVHGNAMDAIEDVIDILEREQVERIIVGVPLLLSGKQGESARKAQGWTRELMSRLLEYRNTGQIQLNDVPIVELQDERLTTVTAHRQLSDTRISTRDHRPMVDQQSAVLILQSALGARHADAIPSNEAA